VKWLEAQGKKVFFLTNNATKSIEDIQEKMSAFGYKAKAEQIYTSAKLAAKYLC
jgi:ribonucleotide monophosphatase NagD (HAD superfamily)